jgi:two-component sensor histidine kinase
VQTRKRSHSLAEFSEAFEARLDALARTQDLLVTSPSGEADLHDIVRNELEAFGVKNGRKLSVTGPRVLLSARGAQTMAMIIHELSTNALKHGALRGSNGRIEIQWRTDFSNDRTCLAFEWQEHGVKIGEAAPAKGFGFTVIERSSPHMLGGSAELTFEPDGVACRIEFPLPA